MDILYKHIMPSMILSKAPKPCFYTGYTCTIGLIGHNSLTNSATRNPNIKLLSVLYP